MHHYCCMINRVIDALLSSYTLLILFQLAACNDISSAISCVMVVAYFVSMLYC